MFVESASDRARRDHIASIVDSVRYHAKVRPDHPALIFLPDGEVEVGRVTYGELDQRATAFAAYLQEQGLTDQAVLLMLPSSIHYVVAFLGCLYAHAIAVPMYPPSSSIHVKRLAQVVVDCGARAVLFSTENQRQGIEPRLMEFLPDNDRCLFLSIEKMNTQGLVWQEPTLCETRLAYLQYTSGSTGRPRGVMVTHHNILAHCKQVQTILPQNQNSICVNWLPLFHDMGMILGLIQPLYIGATNILMPPLAFLQKPMRWLHAISRYQATTSYAPNFAYELCAAAFDDLTQDSLDLSSWEIAINGAEPVRTETLERFVQRFGDNGFRYEAFRPGYGLAESTLALAIGQKLTPARLLTISDIGLEHNRFIPPEAGEQKMHTIVSCGQALPDTRLLM
jgi:acyl-CoA synthetase (AMP-forming)/AMP-acid ligase II